MKRKREGKMARGGGNLRFVFGEVRNCSQKYQFALRQRNSSHKFFHPDFIFPRFFRSQISYYSEIFVPRLLLLPDCMVPDYSSHKIFVPEYLFSSQILLVPDFFLIPRNLGARFFAPEVEGGRRSHGS